MGMYEDYIENEKKTKIEYECPECKKKIIVSLNDLGKTVHCPNCNKDVIFEDDEFLNATLKLKESMKKFDRNYDKLEKWMEDEQE